VTLRRAILSISSVVVIFWAWREATRDVVSLFTFSEPKGLAERSLSLFFDRPFCEVTGIMLYTVGTHTNAELCLGVVRDV
jgi:hypothetical protein